jgi:hypothetical protein
MHGGSLAGMAVQVVSGLLAIAKAIYLLKVVEMHT